MVMYPPKSQPLPQWHRATEARAWRGPEAERCPRNVPEPSRSDAPPHAPPLTRPTPRRAMVGYMYMYMYMLGLRLCG